MGEKRLVKCTGLGGETCDYYAYPEAIPPYPPSEYIVGIKFDRFRYHAGEGDMWPLTWARDDNIYAAAGDNKASPLNFWRVSQGSAWDPTKKMDDRKLTHTNDWTIDIINRLPVDPKTYCLTAQAPSVKPSGLLDIDGRLYMAVEAQNYGEDPLFCRQKNMHGSIVISDDGGVHWDLHATPADFFTGRLSSCHFLQFGRGYAGARDEYVYAYFPCGEDGGSYWENGDGLLLGRVEKTRITQRAAWTFYAGNGAWSEAETDARMVFRYPKMTGADNVCYAADIDRYILLNYSFIDPQLRPRPIHQMKWPQAYRSQLTMFEGENPWGPWKLFHRDDDWGTYGDYQPSIPTKWIYCHGRLMFMVSAGSWDDYNFVVQKLAIRLAGDADFIPQAAWFDYR